MAARKFTQVEDAILDNTNALAYASPEQRVILLKERHRLYEALDKERSK